MPGKTVGTAITNMQDNSFESIVRDAARFRALKELGTGQAVSQARANKLKNLKPGEVWVEPEWDDLGDVADNAIQNCGWSVYGLTNGAEDIAKRWRFVASYLASCHAASLEGLPKRASNYERMRHITICEHAADYIVGNSIPPFFGNMQNEILWDIKRCREAAARARSVLGESQCPQKTT